jgi:hypothetical protein
VADAGVVDLKSATQEELIRAQNIKAVEKAVVGEQKRRMSLTAQTAVNEELERQRNQKDADSAVEEERQRRMNEDAHTTTQEELLRQQSINEAKKLADVCESARTD